MNTHENKIRIKYKSIWYAVSVSVFIRIQLQPTKYKCEYTLRPRQNGSHLVTSLNVNADLSNESQFWCSLNPVLG